MKCCYTLCTQTTGPKCCYTLCTQTTGPKCCYTLCTQTTGPKCCYTLCTQTTGPKCCYILCTQTTGPKCCYTLCTQTTGPKPNSSISSLLSLLLPILSNLYAWTSESKQLVQICECPYSVAYQCSCWNPPLIAILLTYQALTLLTYKTLI